MDVDADAELAEIQSALHSFFGTVTTLPSTSVVDNGDVADDDINSVTTLSVAAVPDADEMGEDPPDNPDLAYHIEHAVDHLRSTLDILKQTCMHEVLHDKDSYGLDLAGTLNRNLVWHSMELMGPNEDIDIEWKEHAEVLMKNIMCVLRCDRRFLLAEQVARIHWHACSDEKIYPISD